VEKFIITSGTLPLNLITDELQARTIGRQYSIEEFENTPDNTLLNWCGVN
jgi:hypothetical protein